MRECMYDCLIEGDGFYFRHTRVHIVLVIQSSPLYRVG